MRIDKRARTCRGSRSTRGWVVLITTKSSTQVKGPFTRPEADRVRTTLHPSLFRHAQVLPTDRAPYGTRPTSPA
jgi:hypothetical protein